jgi:hypothetical protein
MKVEKLKSGFVLIREITQAPGIINVVYSILNQEPEIDPHESRHMNTKDKQIVRNVYINKMTPADKTKLEEELEEFIKEKFLFEPVHKITDYFKE